MFSTCSSFVWRVLYGIYMIHWINTLVFLGISGPHFFCLMDYSKTLKNQLIFFKANEAGAVLPTELVEKSCTIRESNGNALNFIACLGNSWL